MNEDRICDTLNKNFYSINDMTTPIFNFHKKKFFLENKNILKKYISIFLKLEIFIRNLISKYFFDCNGIFYENDVDFSYCRIKLGKKNVLIPFEINCTMESILTKNLKVSGLFRRSTTISNLKECHQTIQFCKHNSMNRLDVINQLLRFDLITLTSVYKQLFDHFSMSLFPIIFKDLFMKINDLNDENEKIILIKFIIYSMPKPNRNLLDSICCFFALIQNLIEDWEAEARNMDMHGFAVVMMPKIFIRSNINLDLNIIEKYIDVLEFIFLKRKILFAGTDDDSTN